MNLDISSLIVGLTDLSSLGNAKYAVLLALIVLFVFLIVFLFEGTRYFRRARKDIKRRNKKKNKENNTPAEEQ